MKRILALLLAFTLLLPVFPVAFADEEAPILDPDVPEYENISDASVALKKESSTRAKITILCQGMSGTTNVTATVHLAHWTGSSWEVALINGNTYVTATGTNSVNTSFTTSVSGGTYRATAVYTVTRNGTSETITVRSSSVTF